MNKYNIYYERHNENGNRGVYGTSPENAEDNLKGIFGYDVDYVECVQLLEITVKPIGFDELKRELFQEVDGETKYIAVDGKFYVCSKNWEIVKPLDNCVKVMIQKVLRESL